MSLWIDLSDISVWNGHHTGIQRLVYQIAKRFAVQGQTKFFVFDQRSRNFKEFDFGQVEAQINSHETESHAESYSPPPDRLRSVAYRLYAASPYWLKDRMASPANKARLRRAYHGLKTISRPKMPKRKGGGEGKIVKFAGEDAVLVMGKVWDYYPDYIEAMSAAKQTSKFKLVQVVYDLIPVFSPHLFGYPLIEPYTKHMFETAAISDGLLAISKSTKRDTQKFCREMLLPEPTVEVIRLGDDFIEAEAAKPAVEVLAKGNFLLCVGTLEVRKNHQLLYTAYREGVARGIDLPHLVIVGGTGWYVNDVIHLFTNDPAIKDKVHILQNVNDRELKWLYENCRFTVYPSVYEGWGLPVAESLAYGKLCLTANVSSMPEIAGNLIDYFSPYDSGGCISLIEKYLDPAMLAAKEAEIKKSYRPTTWDDTFGQVKAFIDQKL